ncbi:phytanoyl-CoA dioxygenase family protein [bacterium]|nr:phytanoyl-CoA dioxygenase family protein [bacterium]
MDRRDQSDFHKVTEPGQRNTQSLTSRGRLLDVSSKAFGTLTEFPLDPISEMTACQRALQQEGYLYLKAFWNRTDILSARAQLLEAIAKAGLLDPSRNPMEAIPKPSKLNRSQDKRSGSATIGTIVDQVPAIKKILFEGRIMDFFDQFLGGSSLHYDQIWYRSIKPGLGTAPHCDIVYMGRGTQNLYTAWVPWGDIDLRMGGLMILEDSLAQQQRLSPYLHRDVDSYCSNRPQPDPLDLDAKSDRNVWSGWLSENPVSLRERLGGRWLTAKQFEMGDLVIFSTKLVHASLDNHSDQIRISTDTRYQLASQPVDERWVGPGPLGHIGRHKRGRIC